MIGNRQGKTEAHSQAWGTFRLSRGFKLPNNRLPDKWPTVQLLLTGQCGHRARCRLFSEFGRIVGDSEVTESLPAIRSDIARFTGILACTPP